MPKKRKTAREQKQKLKEVKAYFGKDMNGERIQKSFYGKTLSEAKEKADEYKEQQKRGESVNSSIIFIEWAEKWMKTYKEPNIKSSTYQFKYKSFLETHLKPYFKQVKVANIKQIDIQNFINSKSGVTKDTQERYVYILKSIFESAIENNIIYKNPVNKIVFNSKASSTKKRTYNQAEVDTIIEFARTHKNGASIIILLKTGLRRGELLGLKFDDIDYKNNILNLKRSVADVPVNDILTTVVEDGSNETKNHNRQIPFDNIVRETLLNVKKTSEYIFPNAKGELNSPNNYSRRQYAHFMKDLRKKYPEIKKLTPHELRRTCGTLLYESGVDMRVLQKIMGHADLKTTSEIYIQDNVDFMKNEIDKVKFDKEYQLLIEKLDNKIIILTEYYEALLKMQNENKEYLSLKTNNRAARNFIQEIERARAAIQKA